MHRTNHRQDGIRRLTALLALAALALGGSAYAEITPAEREVGRFRQALDQMKNVLRMADPPCPPRVFRSFEASLPEVSRGDGDAAHARLEILRMLLRHMRAGDAQTRLCLRRVLREIDEKTKWGESGGEGLRNEVFRRMVERMGADEKDDSSKRARDEEEALRRARRAAEEPEAKAADIEDAVDPDRKKGRLGFAAARGSSLVLTGRVVAKKPAWGSVVGPQGATLSGVVVDVGGEEQVTDAEGRFEIPAAEEGESIEIALVGEAATSAALPVVAARAHAAGPVIENAPSYMVLGDTGSIEGRALVSAGPEQVRARLGDEELRLLAAHDEELVARIPPDAPLGEADLVVENELGSSDAFPVTVIALGLSSTDTTLERGARGTLSVHVEGTGDRVRLEVTNLTPDVISLEGGASVIVQTSGGPENRAELSFVGVSPGDYGISARPLEK